MAMQYRKRRIDLRSITLSLADVARVYERLSGVLCDEAGRQISESKRLPEQTELDFATKMDEARRRAFRITVTVFGSDGDDLFGDDVGVFLSSNLPADIRGIYMTNVVAYEMYTGVKPPNAFELMLDFAKPPLIDNNNPVSNPTPNQSSLSVEGNRAGWVASISEAVLGVTSKKSNGRKFFHAAFIYDLGLFVIGLPLGLYLSWRLSSLISQVFGERSYFLAGVAYLYVVMMAIWSYRLLFGYTRWAFPTVDLRENEGRSNHHRYVWAAIVLGVLGNAAYEIGKALVFS